MKTLYNNICGLYDDVYNIGSYIEDKNFNISLYEETKNVKKTYIEIDKITLKKSRERLYSLSRYYDLNIYDQDHSDNIKYNHVLIYDGGKITFTKDSITEFISILDDRYSKIECPVEFKNP